MFVNPRLLREFAKLDPDIFPNLKFKISIEAGSTDTWKKYVDGKGITFGINEFGKSAPYKDIYKYFGLESTNIKNITKKLLKK